MKTINSFGLGMHALVLCIVALSFNMERKANGILAVNSYIKEFALLMITAAAALFVYEYWKKKEKPTIAHWVLIVILAIFVGFNIM